MSADGNLNWPNTTVPVWDRSRLVCAAPRCSSSCGLRFYESVDLPAYLHGKKLRRRRKILILWDPWVQMYCLVRAMTLLRSHQRSVSTSCYRCNLPLCSHSNNWVPVRLFKVFSNTGLPYFASSYTYTRSTPCTLTFAQNECTCILSNQLQGHCNKYKGRGGGCI